MQFSMVVLGNFLYTVTPQLSINNVNRTELMWRALGHQAQDLP